jgi:hypothetical protein
MKIVITEEKSSHVMEKLHKIKKMSKELLECFEESAHEMNMRRPRHHEMEDDDDDEYPYNERRGFRGGRY